MTIATEAPTTAASSLEALAHWRRKLGGELIRSSLEGLARAGSLHPKAYPARHGVRLVKNVPYLAGGGPRGAHLLDVYLPPADKYPGPRPAVLYLHGGAFRILSKDTHWLMGLAFARRGYVVFNANYRLAPAHPFPAALDDVAEALAWVSSHAQAFGADAQRLVLAGESAGANLSLAMTLAHSYERPEPFAKRVHALPVKPVATLPACGILQVSDWERFVRRRPSLLSFVTDRLRETEHSYLSEARRDLPGGLALADPLCVLEEGVAPVRPLPPMCAPCGTKDILLEDSRRLQRALGKLGVECEAPVYPGEVHAFHAFYWRPEARRCWGDMLAFADKYAKP